MGLSQVKSLDKRGRSDSKRVAPRYRTRRAGNARKSSNSPASSAQSRSAPSRVACGGVCVRVSGLETVRNHMSHMHAM